MINKEDIKLNIYSSVDSMMVALGYLNYGHYVPALAKVYESIEILNELAKNLEKIKE